MCFFYEGNAFGFTIISQREHSIGAVKKRSESHSRTSQPLVFAGFGRI